MTNKPAIPIVLRWRHRLGLLLFFMSYPLFYATPLVVPFLGFSAAHTVAIIAVTMAAIYGIWLLSIPLLGVDGFRALRQKYFGWLILGRFDKTKGPGARH